ncbi:hypothetical protein NDU88_011476, partial [Pleurodeles waltl]
ALEDEVFHGALVYFTLNKGTASDRRVEWETLKVVIRGHCLGQTVGIRRDLTAEVLRIETTLRRWESELGINPEATRLLSAAQEAHNEALERRCCHDYNIHTNRIHEEEVRAGTLLAWLIKPESRGTPITHLTTQDRTILHPPTHINDEFRSCYMTLYSAPLLAERSELHIYLSGLQLRMLPGPDIEQLGAPVTAMEMQTAIKYLVTGKTTWSDGLPP